MTVSSARSDSILILGFSYVNKELTEAPSGVSLLANYFRETWTLLHDLILTVINTQYVFEPCVVFVVLGCESAMELGRSWT